MSPATRALWLGSAFLAGAVVMGLEMLAFRLYAPYLGYSIYVWGSMISVVLLALAAGYAVGGRRADRSNDDAPLFVLILASGLYLLLLLLVVDPLLAVFASLGAPAGSLIATLVLFAPPMTGLAAVGPFVIRLLARSGQVGRTAGAVYAVSTVGSVCGIAATTFGLIPTVGSRLTLATLCAVVVLLGAGGLLRYRRSAALWTAALAVLPIGSQPRVEDDTAWLAESEYNLVQVRRRDGFVGLVLNRGDLIQSAVREGGGFTYQVFDQWALGPLLVPTRRALVLGMGAGASLASLRWTAPHAEVDAVELDSRVVEAGERFFGLRRDAARLRIHVADARSWLRAGASGRYDVVQLDVYQGGPTIPFYLSTREFFQEVRAHMSDDAVLMMNVVDPSAEAILLDAVAATLQQVFAGPVALSTREHNHLLFAFTRPRGAAWMRERLATARPPKALVPLLESAAPALYDLRASPDAMILTDDHAPIEALTRLAWASKP